MLDNSNGPITKLVKLCCRLSDKLTVEEDTWTAESFLTQQAGVEYPG